MFRLLFLGDITGESGIDFACRRLGALREKHAVDLCCANAENTANGLGVSRRALARLRKAGVDFFTSGNHVFDKDAAIPFIATSEFLIRPANYPPGTPGAGHRIIEVARPGGAPPVRVLFVNLLGRLFLTRAACPFRTAEEIFAAEAGNFDLSLVDFHAEATAEKMALGLFLDGRATAVVGTHTHVQTNDARVLPGGTAYLTDAGMTGALESVIGVTAGPVLDFFRRRRFRPWGPAKGRALLNGCLITADETTGRALAIETLVEHEAATP